MPSNNAKKGGDTVRKSTMRNGSSTSSGDNDVVATDHVVGRGNSRENDEDEEFEPGSWECTVCTFRNHYEAFKCLMCDTRKGTSTRKPRLNPSVVQQQTLVQKLAVEVEKAQQKKQRNSGEIAARSSPECFSPIASTSANSNSPMPARTSSALSNCSQHQQQQKSSKLIRRRPIPFQDALVVRSAAKKTVVTVNGVSFTITEFKPRTSPRGRKKLSANSSLANTNNGIGSAE